MRTNDKESSCLHSDADAVLRALGERIKEKCEEITSSSEGIAKMVEAYAELYKQLL